MVGYTDTFRTCLYNKRIPDSLDRFIFIWEGILYFYPFHRKLKSSPSRKINSYFSVVTEKSVAPNKIFGCRKIRMIFLPIAESYRRTNTPEKTPCLIKMVRIIESIDFVRVLNPDMCSNSTLNS